MPESPPETFEYELQHLLNRYSVENRSDTPDFILAQYLQQCLLNWNYCVRRRDQWHGFKPPLKGTEDG
jgi:hypothetical protein